VSELVNNYNLFNKFEIHFKEVRIYEKIYSVLDNEKKDLKEELEKDKTQNKSQSKEL